MRLKLPVSVWISSKKEFRLNLNEYRNAHYQTLNKAKIAFKEQMLAYRSLRIPFEPPYLFRYTLYWKDNRRLDVNNVLTVVDKFAADGLVEFGLLTDDHKKVVSGTDFRWGGICKGNAHIILEILPYQE